jgi:membrane protein involved in D-alanine export
MASPYANFFYFGLLLFVVVPTVLLGMFGRANGWWSLCLTALMLLVHSSQPLQIGDHWRLQELWVALAYLVWQSALAYWLLSQKKSRTVFYLAIALSIVPLVAAKYLPMVRSDHGLGFLGISYVTFRALDVLFSIHDGILTSLPPARFAVFLFFFPTVSSGPVDRYRRFVQDWERKRSRAEFLGDLDADVHRVFRGFFYKFIIAALIKTHWLDKLEGAAGFGAAVSYMYAYSLYLFFDFAGYSAFAIAFSYLLGIRTPENFNLPFLSRNIRDFWNRWHITLSFWFRDHIYMRFLLAAGKGKWFRGKHTASYLGLFLTFGLMGLWHGSQLHYLIYGMYHAALLSGFDTFARWNKQHKVWGDTRVFRVASIVVTFHVVCFGLLIFSGWLGG